MAFVEADCVSSHLLDFMRDRTEWTGTPTVLYDLLCDLASDTTKRQRSWPKAASALGKRLREAAPSLNRSGIEIVFPKGSVRTYAITGIRQSGDSAVLAVSAVINPEKTGGLGAQAGLQADITDEGLPVPLQAELQAVTAEDDLPVDGNPRENGRKDGKDGRDGRIHPLSNGDDRLDLDPDEEARISMREGA